MKQAEQYKLSVLIPVWNQEELVLNALDHLPRRDDIEVIVRDDGSTDNTLHNLLEYQWTHPELNLTVTANGENHGMYYTSNRLMEMATGEYVHMHNSDDYVDTEKYTKLIDKLDGNIDVLGFDIRINNGCIWRLNESTAHIHCAQVIRFIRRAFVDGLKWNEEMKAASDYYYNEEMMKRNPVTVYSGEVVYIYNFPREGSLVDLRARGIIGE